MIFKNAHVFRLTRPLEADSSQLGVILEQQMEQQKFIPCSGIRPSSFGWVSPLGLLDPDNSSLIHEVAGSILLCAKREDKVIPTSALGDVLAEKITRLESLEDRPIRAKEKQRLKEDALAELLPRALPKSKQIFGYLSPSEDLLVIDTGSATEAEMFLSCLRDTLGSLNVVPPQVKSKPTDTFTHWLLSRKMPPDFSLGEQCDLIDLEDGSSVTCRKQDLDSREITVHLDAGKICSRLALIWHGDLRVTIDKDLVLRQIKIISSDDEAETNNNPVAELDAAFVNMTLELSRFLPALFTALGGESRE
jgi:recombination associated protein RdgC